MAAPTVAPARADAEGEREWQPTVEAQARARAEKGEEDEDSGHDNKDRDASDDLVRRGLAVAAASGPHPEPSLPLLSSVASAAANPGSCPQSRPPYCAGGTAARFESEGSSDPREDEVDTTIAPAATAAPLPPKTRTVRLSSSFLLSARSSLVVSSAPSPSQELPPEPTTSAPSSLTPAPAIPSRGPPLPLITVTADDDGRPGDPEANLKMRGTAPNLQHTIDVPALHVQPNWEARGSSSHLEDSSSTTTSVFHIEGARHGAPPSLASGRRLFTTLLPPTPLADQRPSSSQSHLTGARGGYGGLDLLSASDPWSEREGRISSESAMTVLQRDLQREGAYRRKMDHADEGPVDVTASMTRREFEALPPAIQRKYFSILERHRFFQEPSPTTPGPTPLDTFGTPDTHRGPDAAKIPTAPNRPRELQLKHSTDQYRSRPKRRSSRRASFYLNLPDKIRRQHLTFEEQLVVSKLRSQNQTLDPINDVLREGFEVRKTSKPPKPKHLYIPPPGLLVRPKTMDSHQPSLEGTTLEGQTVDSFYESCRWLDEEKELDLKLYLDDYHAGLRQDLPPATDSRRPSFRRTMSITKLPFGRSSVSSSRPGTMHASSPVLPRYTPTSPSSPPAYHTGRRTRAMSWMSMSKQNQVTRGYSTQPSTPQTVDFGGQENVQPCYPVNAAAAPQLKKQASEDDDNLQTFLADDKSSIYSDEASAAEPESPKTPLGMGKSPLGLNKTQLKMDKTAVRPLRVEEASFSPKPSGEFPSAPSTREITLRMTLTRADLRANENELYGWQRTCQPKKSRTLLEDYDPVTCAREGNSKESIEWQLAAMDQWHAQVQDRGKMKRLWHKVRGV